MFRARKSVCLRLELPYFNAHDITVLSLCWASVCSNATPFRLYKYSKRTIIGGCSASVPSPVEIRTSSFFFLHWIKARDPEAESDVCSRLYQHIQRKRTRSLTLAITASLWQQHLLLLYSFQYIR